MINTEKIKFEKVDLKRVVDFISGKLSDLIDNKKLTLTITNTGANTIYGRTVAVEQIVMNLLKNSINYTSSGGKINIYIQKDEQDFVELRVEDSGIGIAKGDRFHVFEPFYRVDLSRTRGHGGSGLGLAIVNELVKMHNGNIHISSALKQGTTVTVSFPPHTEI